MFNFPWANRQDNVDDNLAADVNSLAAGINSAGQHADDLFEQAVQETDIVNDLTTGGSSVPLSAEQGKVLKGLADAGNAQISQLSDVSNLLDGTTWTTGEYANVSTGAIGTSASFMRTDYIPIDPTKSYLYIKGFNVGSNGCFYTSAKAFISGITTNGRIAIPSNAAYFLGSASVSISAAAACSVRYVNIGNLYERTYSEQLAYNPYRGALASFLGDSITEAVSIAYPYHAVIKDCLQLGKVNNAGSSGTSISASNGVSASGSFTNRYSNINNAVNLVVVFGGTNDYGGNTPMGTIADTTDISFYGALRVLCEGLINKFLGQKIVFITPIHRSVETANSVGKTLTDYRNAIIEVCSLYGIPTIDGFTLGFNSLANFQSAYMSDGLHPNQNGHYILGQAIAVQLARL